MRHGPTGRAQRISTGGHQWSDEAEEIFFDRLNATCNVRASAAAAGFTTFTVYRQKRLRPEFAEKWRAALTQGYDAIEMALVRTALDSLDDAAFDGDRPIPKMTVEQAMNVLRAHRGEVRGIGRGPGRHARPPTLDEVRASILRKVEAIKRTRAAGKDA
ncbi:MAG: hypothetical protein AB7O91_12170 [Sphingomonas sp.]